MEETISSHHKISKRASQEIKPSQIKIEDILKSFSKPPTLQEQIDRAQLQDIK